MTRLLVVHPNPLVVWDRAAALEHAGYEVETCPGPSVTDCPALDDQACPLLDRADVLLYDVDLGSPQEMGYLVGHLREDYSDLPLVVVGADDSAVWAALEGPRRVWRVPPGGTVSELAAVIEQAVTEQGMAV
jgi:hypothetical protein